jgi:hypothetical protein
MLRLLAWIKYADERLQFTRGLSGGRARSLAAQRSSGYRFVDRTRSAGRARLKGLHPVR